MDALEQAELYVEERYCDEWKRAAYISVNVLNAPRGKKDKKLKLSDLWKDPREEREKKKKQTKIDLNDKEKLKQIALAKGIKLE